MALRTPEDRYIDIGRIRTRFWRLGDSGPTLILLHGLGASAEIWIHNIDALAKNHRVFVPDLPGFGKSGKPSFPFSPFDYAHFVDDFMKALDIGQATLIGQSLGGGVALQYALEFPKKVKKLVLADCAGFGKEVIWTLRLMSLPWIGEIVSFPSRIGVSLFFKFAVRNPTVITKDFVDTYYELFNRPGFQAFLLKMTRSLVNIRGARMEMLAPVLENLHQISHPMLILWGQNDRVFPVSHAHDGRERIPGARLHVFDRCGHIPNLEKCDEFNRIVLDFLLGNSEDIVA